MTKHQILEIFPIGPEFPDHRRFDPISAVSAGVGLVGNVVSGFMGNSAAKKAGAVQQQAANEAAGKIGEATGQANTGIADATQNAQTLATAGGQRVVDTAGAGKAFNDEQVKNANSLLDPYATTGNTATTALNTGLAAGGDFNKAPTMADLQIDPGYAFRQQQGELALQRSGAAHGGALGGAAAKDAMTFNSGLASQEYQNAYNRFETSTQNRFSNLMTASNSGQAASGKQGDNLTNAGQFDANLTTNAATTDLGANEFAGQAGMTGATQIGNNLMNGAKTQADLTTGGAAAKAAGIVGGSNALTAGLAGGVNSFTGAANTRNLLRNPAIGGSNAVVNPNTGGYYSSTSTNPDGSLTVHR